MPGFIVHVGATVLCTHGGTAMPTSPNPRVLVGGQPATTIAAPYSIAGCPFAPGGAASPCVTGQWLTGSTRVLAGGQPLVLQSSSSTCIPNATPLNVISTQARVQAT